MEQEVKEVMDEETLRQLMNTEGTPQRQDVMARIEKTLNKIRPYIQADGGDVELIDFQDGVVTVQMLGACAGCMSLDVTLTDGIEAILIDEVEEVRKVQMKENEPYSFLW